MGFSQTFLAMRHEAKQNRVKWTVLLTLEGKCEKKIVEKIPWDKKNKLKTSFFIKYWGLQ